MVSQKHSMRIGRACVLLRYLNTRLKLRPDLGEYTREVKEKRKVSNLIEGGTKVWDVMKLLSRCAIRLRFRTMREKEEAVSVIRSSPPRDEAERKCRPDYKLSRILAIPRWLSDVICANDDVG